ncbi:CPBP family intramembrane glutamic endopeptidase [Castellaniella sp. GW247-6E4]|uniref:CPBP family intramembrane glutamic endopeptidase n=1 Tax=Castellaniella sp. GW247-6E4 TaxID=3140380 RepID=UPI00331597E5
MSGKRDGHPVGLRAELMDFLRFVRRPRPGRRLPGRAVGHGVQVDFLPNIRGVRLIQWALLLWLANLFVFGPLAVGAAEMGGAQHRLSLANLPWMQALIWAPIVEELTFRHVLRRPAMVWWFVPLMVSIVVQGAGFASGLMAAVALLLCLAPLWCPASARLRGGWSLSWARRRGMLRAYPWLYHLSAVAFGAVHLYNFQLYEMPIALMPLLVLPQWFTGLVLGWMRVRRGIGASMLLHALFNAGPLLIVLLILRFAPGLA